MEHRSEPPVTYRVVGAGTDVGKTTLAAALIKVLNDRGERAVGFKPFSAVRLNEAIDFMFETYPSAPSKLFGQDAWKLASASPLTGVDWLDLIVPTQLLCYPNWETTILLRCGSTRLDNVEYFCSDYGAELRGRRDFRRVIEKTGLPFAKAAVRADLGFEFAAAASAEKSKGAFGCLLDIGVDTVVCEGTGAWLPVWRDCPPVNHVIHLSDGVVKFFPAVDMAFTFQASEAVRSVNELIEILKRENPSGFSVPLYLAEEARRDDMAQWIVRELLSSAERSGQIAFLEPAASRPR